MKKRSDAWVGTVCKSKSTMDGSHNTPKTKHYYCNFYRKSSKMESRRYQSVGERLKCNDTKQNERQHNDSNFPKLTLHYYYHYLSCAHPYSPRTQ